MSFGMWLFVGLANLAMFGAHLWVMQSAFLGRPAGWFLLIWCFDLTFVAYQIVVLVLGIISYVQYRRRHGNKP